jgi:hypothetical protein
MATANAGRVSFLARSASLGAPQVLSSKHNSCWHPDNWSATTLSCAADILQLNDAAGRLTQQHEPMLDPGVFLASASGGWRPKVVCVRSASEIVGIMYAKERMLYGIPTGIVYADGSLGGFFLASAKCHANALCIAIEALLDSPGVRGVHLRVLEDSREWRAVTQFASSRSLDVRSVYVTENARLWKHHAHLPLPDTYNGFLERLGSTTRHNFRYYRKRFESSGHRFVDALPLDELRVAMLALQPNSKFHARMPKAQVEQHFNMVAASRRPLAIGLRHRQGEWMSVIGGWYRPDGAVLCFQYNNERDFGRDSLSVVLRSYLIELLIRKGLPQLVIWGGTKAPLSRYVTCPSTISVRLDVPTRLWRLARRLLSTIGPRLPKRWANGVQWIS